MICQLVKGVILTKIISAINKELESYNSFDGASAIIVANKMDMPDSAENLKTFKKKISRKLPVNLMNCTDFPNFKFDQIRLVNFWMQLPELLDKTPEFHFMMSLKWKKEAYYEALMKILQPLKFHAMMTLPGLIW